MTLLEVKLLKRQLLSTQVSINEFLEMNDEMLTDKKKTILTFVERFCKEALDTLDETIPVRYE